MRHSFPTPERDLSSGRQVAPTERQVRISTFSKLPPEAASFATRQFFFKFAHRRRKSSCYRTA